MNQTPDPKNQTIDPTACQTTDPQTHRPESQSQNLTDCILRSMNQNQDQTNEPTNQDQSQRARAEVGTGNFYDSILLAQDKRSAKNQTNKTQPRDRPTRLNTLFLSICVNLHKVSRTRTAGHKQVGELFLQQHN